MTKTFTDSTEMHQFVERLKLHSSVDSFSVTEIKETVISTYKKETRIGSFGTVQQTFDSYWKKDSLFYSIDNLIRDNLNKEVIIKNNN